MKLVLADTSIWVDHFRKSNAGLRTLIELDALATHPFVIGELACGSLRNREVKAFEKLKPSDPGSWELGDIISSDPRYVGSACWRRSSSSSSRCGRAPGNG